MELKQKKALVKVINYLLENEVKHYEENPTEDHILHSVSVIIDILPKKDIERIALDYLIIDKRGLDEILGESYE